MPKNNNPVKIEKNGENYNIYVDVLSASDRQLLKSRKYSQSQLLDLAVKSGGGRMQEKTPPKRPLRIQETIPPKKPLRIQETIPPRRPSRSRAPIQEESEESEPEVPAAELEGPIKRIYIRNKSRGIYSRVTSSFGKEWKGRLEDIGINVIDGKRGACFYWRTSANGKKYKVYPRNPKRRKKSSQ